MPLRFGRVVHATLERLLWEVIDQERTGPLDEDRALALFSEAWGAERMTGLHEFGEGVAMIRAFVRTQGVLDSRDVLAVEKEFRLPAGRFMVLGYVDRVDRADDETNEIVDYKTNRQFFTREEVDESLQMSLYELAARRIWPWVKRVRLSFVMLRHGVRQTTTLKAAGITLGGLVAVFLPRALRWGARARGRRPLPPVPEEPRRRRRLSPRRRGSVWGCSSRG